MNKREFIRFISKESGYTLVATEKFLDTMTGCILSLLDQGESISISHFGKFYSAETKGQTVKSPWSDTPITIPARIIKKFKFFNSVK